MLICTECVDCGKPLVESVDLQWGPETPRCDFCAARLPWDGVWTLGLLQALAAFSVKGEFRIKTHCGQSWTYYTVRRETVRCETTWGRQRDRFTVYGSDGLATVDNALGWLNSEYAVPINDDGSVWKSRRVN